MFVYVVEPTKQPRVPNKNTVQFTTIVNGSVISFSLSNPKRNNANNREYLRWELDLNTVNNSRKIKIGTVSINFPDYSNHKLLKAIDDNQEFLDKLLEQIKYQAEKKLRFDSEHPFNLVTNISSYRKTYWCETRVTLDNPDALHELLKEKEI